MPPTDPGRPDDPHSRPRFYRSADRSDAELTEAIRNGAPATPAAPGAPAAQGESTTPTVPATPTAEAQAALDELYRRHRPALLAYARSCCRDPHTAEDLASEAFARTLQALRSGGGPTEAWRPYLLTTLRRTAASWADNARRTELAPDFERWLSDTSDPAAESGEERVLRLEDSHLVLQAFHSLPERWQTALWHSTVEGDPPSRVATLLGISPSGLASLTSRAREGLREAYLAAHIARRADTATPPSVSPSAPPSDECRRFTGPLAASVRRGARHRTDKDLERHLADCPACHRARLELTELNDSLRTVLPAALLFWAGSAYLSKAASAAATTAAGAGAVTGTGTGAATGAGAGTSAGATAATATGIATSTKIGAAVGASVLALAVGGFVLYPGPDDDRADPAPPHASPTRTGSDASPSPSPSPSRSTDPADAAGRAARSPGRSPSSTTASPSPAADDRTRLRVMSTGLCMEIGPGTGAHPREAGCDGGRSQQWELLVNRPAQEVRVRNRATGLCLVHTGTEADGAPVRQGSCATTSRTVRWTYFKKDDGLALAQQGSSLHFLGLDDWHDAAEGRTHSPTIGTTSNYYNTKSLRFRYDGDILTA